MYFITCHAQEHLVASIPIPGGRSLRPVKNSFDKVGDQNIPPIFLLSPIFQSTPLTKKPIFTPPTILHWANYTLNEIFSPIVASLGVVYPSLPKAFTVVPSLFIVLN